MNVFLSLCKVVFSVGIACFMLNTLASLAIFTAMVFNWIPFNGPPQRCWFIMIISAWMMIIGGLPLVVYYGLQGLR